MLEAPVTKPKEATATRRSAVDLELPHELFPPHAGLQVQTGVAFDGRSPRSRALGNQAALRLLSSPAPTVQTKLTVNQPGDQYEQEADRVAEHVMRMPDPAVPPELNSPPSGKANLQRQCTCGGHGGECESCKEKREEGSLQRKETSAGPATAPPIVHQVLSSPGQPLDASTRAFFEPRFGYNLGNVRVHVGPRAAESVSAVNAWAYTVGRDIVFASGRYSPSSDQGKKLIAHELAHTIQQEGSSQQTHGDFSRHARNVEGGTGASQTLGVRQRAARYVARQENKEPISINASFDPSTKTYDVLVEELGRIQMWLQSHPGNSPDRTQLEDVQSQIVATMHRIDKAMHRSTPMVVDVRPFSVPQHATQEVGKLNQQLVASQSTPVLPNQKLTPPPRATAAGDVSTTSPGTSPLAGNAFGLLVLVAPDAAIDLAIAGVDALPGKEALGTLWEVFLRPGLLGFLGKLKSTPKDVKARVLEKIANIFSGKDKDFTWAFLKGLLKGFFIDGALGIFIAIWDLIKGLGKLWDFLKGLGTSVGGLPAPLQSLLDGFDARAAELVGGLGPAIEELKGTMLGPGQSGSLTDLIAEKGKAFAKQGGEAVADKLMGFFLSPEVATEIGETVGDLLGMVLWEVVFAALTAGAGTAVTAVKEGAGTIAKFLSKIVEGVLKVIEEIKVFFGKVVEVVKEAIAFIKGKLKELSSKFVELLEDAGQFFRKLLGACVEHSPVRCDFKAVEKLLKIEKSRSGAMKELAGNLHRLSEELEGQAIAVVEVRVNGATRYAAATNSGAGYGRGWAQAQTDALTQLDVVQIPPFGGELVHAEANVELWAQTLRQGGNKVEFVRWGISAGKEGQYICAPCRAIISRLGGGIEEFSALGKTY